jgi:hypothetical protein
MVCIRACAIPQSAYELAPVWDIMPEGIGLLLHRRLEQGAPLDAQFRFAGRKATH